MRYIVCPQCGSTEIVITESGTCVYDLEASLRVDSEGRLVEDDAHFSYDDFDATQQEISCVDCGYVLAYSKDELKEIPLQFSDEPRRVDVEEEEEND